MTLHYGYLNEALRPFKAIKKADRTLVLVAYDPHDLSKIRVHRLDWSFVCEAELNDVGGFHGQDKMSREHTAQLAKQTAEYKNAVKRVAEHFSPKRSPPKSGLRWRR